jgi:hypothetical protein
MIRFCQLVNLFNALIRSKMFKINKVDQVLSRHLEVLLFHQDSSTWVISSTIKDSTTLHWDYKQMLCAL